MGRSALNRLFAADETSDYMNRTYHASISTINGRNQHHDPHKVVATKKDTRVGSPEGVATTKAEASDAQATIPAAQHVHNGLIDLLEKTYIVPLCVRTQRLPIALDESHNNTQYHPCVERSPLVRITSSTIYINTHFQNRGDLLFYSIRSRSHCRLILYNSTPSSTGLNIW